MLGIEQHVVEADQRASLVTGFKSVWSSISTGAAFSLSAVNGRKEEVRELKRNFHC